MRGHIASVPECNSAPNAHYCAASRYMAPHAVTFIHTSIMIYWMYHALLSVKC